MILLQTLLLVLSFQSAQAGGGSGGDRWGNGGNLIRCGTNAEILFDYWEGERKGLKVDLGSGDYHEMITFALDRLHKVNPSRAIKYRKWFESFESDTLWVKDGTVLPLPDSGVVDLPADCKLIQIAGQKPEEQILPGDKRYLINFRLFNSISEKDKAGLILHEIIYREASLEGHSTSVYVRHFNQLLSSTEITSYDSLKFLELVKTVRLSELDYMGVPIKLTNAEYHPDGSIRKADAIGGMLAGIESTIALKNHRLEFFPSAGIKTISIMAGDFISLKIGNRKFSFESLSNSNLHFHKNGSVASGPLAFDHSIELQDQTVLIGNHATSTDGEAISFHPEGTLKTARLISPLHLKNDEFDVQIIGPVEWDALEILIDQKIEEILAPSKVKAFGQWREIESGADLRIRGDWKVGNFKSPEDLILAPDFQLRTQKIVSIQGRTNIKTIPLLKATGFPKESFFKYQDKKALFSELYIPVDPQLPYIAVFVKSLWDEQEATMNTERHVYFVSRDGRLLATRKNGNLNFVDPTADKDSLTFLNELSCLDFSHSATTANVSHLVMNRDDSAQVGDLLILAMTSFCPIKEPAEGWLRRGEHKWTAFGYNTAIFTKQVGTAEPSKYIFPFSEKCPSGHRSFMLKYSGKKVKTVGPSVESDMNAASLLTPGIQRTSPGDLAIVLTFDRSGKELLAPELVPTRLSLSNSLSYFSAGAYEIPIMDKTLSPLNFKRQGIYLAVGFVLVLGDK